MKKLPSIIITIFTTLFVLIAFEARADLVDNLIKKHKLDPKNNPKDQCELMSDIESKLIEHDVAKMNYCEYGICKYFLNIYEFDHKNKIWAGPSHSYLIYRQNPYEVLGRSLHVEIYSEMSNKAFKAYVKNYETGYFVDMRKHSEFNKILSQTHPLWVRDFNDGILRFAKSEKIKNHNITYFNSKGCYVADHNITKNLLNN